MNDDFTMTNEKVQKDASRLAEILYQFCNIIGYSFRESVTIVTFAIIDFVMIITKQNGGDGEMELERFAQYINAVKRGYEQQKEQEKGAS